MSVKNDRNDLPFRPIRGGLYTSEELSHGFDPDRPESLAEMVDFLTYRYFVMNERATPTDPYVGMMEALHDSSILRAMFAFLKGRSRAAAIMGGHREIRGSTNYRRVVELSKRLSEAGFLMASGGGPGAMEATHLGALLKDENDALVSESIALLETETALPAGAEKVVNSAGEIDVNIVKTLHKWSKPAHELMARLEKRGESLAVPTWHYGHEPVTPLATHAAKYFLNSIREDVLLLLATQGIIFAPGRAGTLQEVFQDAAQNYYPGENGLFSPMVFFDADSFWTKTIPVAPVLEGLYKLGGPEREEQYRKNVLFTDDIEKIIQFIDERAPSPEEMSGRLEKLGMTHLLDPIDGDDAQEASQATPYTIMTAKLAPANAPRSRFLGDLTDQPSLVWSMDRHRVIGRVADGLLSSEARAAVREILAPGQQSTLGDAADWADRLKGSAPKDSETTAFLRNVANRTHGRWHYLNLPYGTTSFDAELLAPFIPEDGAHVVAMLIECCHALVTDNHRLSRTNALRWMTHLIGDLHQPMHLGCGFIDRSQTPPRLVGDPEAARGLEHDRGGNNLTLPAPFNGDTNMHSYWDGTLSSVNQGQLEQAAQALEPPSITTDTIDEAIVSWVEETLQVCKDAYSSISVWGQDPNDNRKLLIKWDDGLSAYEARNEPHVERQMARAAVRLAALVESLVRSK